MTKKQLIESIEAYAAAKATGNINLLQMAAHALRSALDELPEEFSPPEAQTEPVESP